MIQFICNDYHDFKLWNRALKHIQHDWIDWTSKLNSATVLKCKTALVTDSKLINPKTSHQQNTCLINHFRLEFTESHTN